jgi:hypothetical protein
MIAGDVMRITIGTVPEVDTDTFINIICRGDPTQFFSLLLQFGEAVVGELASGSVFTAGTNVLGYHAINITLSSRLTSMKGAEWSKEVTLPDIPDAQRLRTLMRQTGQHEPDQLLGRFMYWFSIASQVRWMGRSLFVMNAREKRWERFYFKPLEDTHRQFSY